ncbi:MAG: 5'-methylthioadenosine/adenosylhomocysteine nucleosidase [Glaciecola sp.]|jgi:adenosylhomocysteine nucleosidase
MKILILGAMDEEIALLTSSLEQMHNQTVGHLTCHIGQYSGHDIIVAKCGIGKVAAALATGILVQSFIPDLVINTGSAGGFDPRVEVGDIVVATDLIQHDVNLTHFGYALGQPAGMPEVFSADAKWVEQALARIEEIPGLHGISGIIGSGDAFIGTDEQALAIRSQFPQFAAVEMEGAAIAQVCYLLNVPCLVIRSISDHANKASSMTFEQYLPVAAKNSANLVLNILQKA